MRRWLLLPLALCIAAFAAYALLSGSPSARSGEAVVYPRKRAVADENAQPSAPQQDEIREESRAKLRDILRDADR